MHRGAITHTHTPIQLGSHTELDSKVLWRVYHCPCAFSPAGLSTLSGSLPQPNAMQGLPTFTPSTSVVGGGLDSLTSVIPLTSAEPIQPLSARGPFNPTAALPSKTVKKILDLEFLEMAEVTLAPELEQIPGRPPAPGRLPITDISQWLERYSLMAATLASRFPEKAAELFAYQATIIRAERNYEAGRWVSYD